MPPPQALDWNLQIGKGMMEQSGALTSKGAANLTNQLDQKYTTSLENLEKRQEQDLADKATGAVTEKGRESIANKAVQEATMAKKDSQQKNAKAAQIQEGLKNGWDLNNTAASYQMTPKRLNEVANGKAKMTDKEYAQILANSEKKIEQTELYGVDKDGKTSGGNFRTQYDLDSGKVKSSFSKLDSSQIDAFGYNMQYNAAADAIHNAGGGHGAYQLYAGSKEALSLGGHLGQLNNLTGKVLPKGTKVDTSFNPKQNKYGPSSPLEFGKDGKLGGIEVSGGGIYERAVEGVRGTGGYAERFFRPAADFFQPSTNASANVSSINASSNSIGNSSLNYGSSISNLSGVVKQGIIGGGAYLVGDAATNAMAGSSNSAVSTLGQVGNNALHSHTLQMAGAGGLMGSAFAGVGAIPGAVIGGVAGAAWDAYDVATKGHIGGFHIGGSSSNQAIPAAAPQQNTTKANNTSTHDAGYYDNPANELKETNLLSSKDSQMSTSNTSYMPNIYAKYADAPQSNSYKQSNISIEYISSNRK